MAGDGFYFGLVNEWGWSDCGETRKLTEGAVCGVWNLASRERSGRGGPRTIHTLQWTCSEETARLVIDFILIKIFIKY